MRDRFKAVLKSLASSGIDIQPGLLKSELQAAELAVGTPIPPDLRRFLSLGVPHGDQFPDWRNPSSPRLSETLDRPKMGLLFDVEMNSFWLDEWGSRPMPMDERLDQATHFLAAAPVLVPVYAHRYLPSQPCQEGNPVISVMQSDIIVYGENLTEYMDREFALGLGIAAPVLTSLDVRDRLKTIPFWGDLVATE